MDESLVQNLQRYAAKQQLRLAERLGYGIHGSVFVAENTHFQNVTVWNILIFHAGRATRGAAKKFIKSELAHGSLPS